MDEQKNGMMNGWIGGWTERRTDEWTKKWMNKWWNEWTDGQMIKWGVKGVGIEINCRIISMWSQTPLCFLAGSVEAIQRYFPPLLHYSGEWLVVLDWLEQWLHLCHPQAGRRQYLHSLSQPSSKSKWNWGCHTRQTDSQWVTYILCMCISWCSYEHHGIGWSQECCVEWKNLQIFYGSEDATVSLSLLFIYQQTTHAVEVVAAISVCWVLWEQRGSHVCALMDIHLGKMAENATVSRCKFCPLALPL